MVETSQGPGNLTDEDGEVEISVPDDRRLAEFDWPWLAAGALLFVAAAFFTYLARRG